MLELHGDSTLSPRPNLISRLAASTHRSERDPFHTLLTQISKDTALPENLKIENQRGGASPARKHTATYTMTLRYIFRGWVGGTLSGAFSKNIQQINEDVKKQRIFTSCSYNLTSQQKRLPAKCA